MKSSIDHWHPAAWKSRDLSGVCILRLVQRRSYPVLGCLPGKFLHRQGVPVLFEISVSIQSVIGIEWRHRQKLVLEHV